MRLVGQAVKTSPSHGENRGSIPLRAVLLKNSPTQADSVITGNGKSVIFFALVWASFVLFRLEKRENVYHRTMKAPYWRIQ